MSVWLLHSNEPTLDLLLDQLELPHGTRLPTHGESTHVIHWGCFHTERPGQRSLQPVKSLLRSSTPRKMAELLEVHGILFDLETNKRRYTYEYLVPVFHLHALGLFQKSYGVFYGAPHPLQKQEESEFTELLNETPPYHAVRAKREAVKAVYALGLDYGVVRIGVRPGGELAVLELQAIPKLTQRLAELFAAAMHRFAQEVVNAQTDKREIMIGADPEFLLRNDQGKVIFASRFLEKEGPVGCDAIVLPGFRKVYPLAELRPEPSSDVGQLIINLRRTMQIATRQIQDESLQWLAGGMPVKGFPLGGHLHFSGTWLNSELLRVMDNYLALPLILLEDATTGNRKPKYGFLGDFRRKRYGGFEYRVLPSWLISPTVAKGVFAMSKLIADHYSLLQARPLNELSMQKAYYEGDKSSIRPLIPGLWGDLTRLPTYRKYEKYLTPIKSMLLRQEGWNEQGDIRRGWKIGPFRIKEESSINS
ncbi:MULTISPECIES: putative amidoligase domain-containing protein [unclassified Paenibacillus]|uniref:putative amidoligase domain-containing protein n=1 Tax=unclassified Paenibacillus TaxID=185978 RepID=UPI003640EA50